MILLTLSVVIIVFTYLQLKYISNKYYWKNQCIPFNSNGKYLGPMLEFLFTNKSGFQIIGDVYKTYLDSPAVGLGSLFGRSLLVTNLTNIQYVLAANFSSFNHRGIQSNNDDLLADNIMFNNGNRWKLMRQHMSPLFTSRKLKSMFYIVNRSAKDFVDYLKNNPNVVRKRSTYDIITSFSNAAIGGAVFGVGTESIFESPFLKMTQKAMNFTTKQNVTIAIANASPKITKILRLKLFKEHEDFFISAVKNIIQARKLNSVQRHDFADLCVSLQQYDVLKDVETGLEVKPTDEFLAAQAFFFFLACGETSTSTIFVTLTELGRHPEVLAKVHEEIDRTFEKHGHITYENLSEIEYLDIAIKEAMRLYPVLGYLSRQCVQDTVLPIGNIMIEKGTNIFIPVYHIYICIHHDAKYYSDPDEYKPERFLNENKQNINDAAFMGFGGGNRICMGKRYAQLQVKTGLVHLLRHYSVRTRVEGDSIRYKRKLIQVRLGNVDIEFTVRSHNKTGED